MKIGILTFWWSQDNYGQLMQCYALQKYLKEFGHDVFLIRYNYETDILKTPLYIKIVKAFNVKQLYLYIKNKQKEKRNKEDEQAVTYDRKFDDFRETFFSFSENYKSYDELKRNPPEADCYIVGSDQVWNFSSGELRNNRNRIHAYFLDFGKNKTKRISYAASWGVKSIKSNLIQEISPLLERFNFVSVREKNGIELCRECNYLNAEWICDPVLLLTAENYRDLYKVKQKRKEYLLLYILKNEMKFDLEKVYDFANKKGLEIIYVTGNGVIDDGKLKTYPTIYEWLSLIDNATYVITNSFHCSVFCNIFNTRFGVIPLTGKHEGMNERFYSLFTMLNCNNRFITDDSFKILDEDFIQYRCGINNKLLKIIEG